MAHQTKELIDFHLRIQKSVTAIMKDGKIDQNDIPEIMLLITELLMAPTSPKMTIEELAEKINDLYDYIMTHYKLFPEDDGQKEQFKRLFDMCVKLALVQPNIKKACKNCFSCLV